MSLGVQITWLFILAIPVATIAWTVTHEEVFKEPREFCVRCSKENRYLLVRKLFYLFTCEYCFSHYVAIGMLILTDFHMLFEDWRGYLISGFSLVWIANIYMNLFYKIRIEIKKEKVIIDKNNNDPVAEEKKPATPTPGN